MKGIDISTHNNVTDYKKLKEQGIGFAIIRCGYGRELSQKDALFEQHYRGLKEAGIKVGCYLYSYADSVEASKLEAENCLNMIKGKTFELPVFYDVEESKFASCGMFVATTMVQTFCDIIEKAGYTPRCLCKFKLV